MLTAQAYLALIRSRSERKLNLTRVYHNLHKQDLFLKAYGNIYANPGATTIGTEPSDSIDGMSLQRIEKIIESLGTGSFRWKASRRIYIPKANGKRRPLSIPSWSDKLVQEVIRLILEAYYEPRFSKHSHGYRPDLSCATALQAIREKGKGAIWFIEGDIEGCFDNINQELLLKRIGQDIQDEKFLKLLREMLKAGYMENGRRQESFVGTPQGGILSPLLANIYLDQLDRYVENELLPQYNRGKGRPTSPEYQRIAREASKARRQGNQEVAETLAKRQRCIRSKVDSHRYRRLFYVRYADDFLLCFSGTKEEATAIKTAIGNFLKTIKLTMSDEKTVITHAATEKARFLGYELKVEWANSYQTQTTLAKKRTINGAIMLRMPEEVKNQWIRRYQKQGKPVHDGRKLHDTVFDIISRYNSEFRGVINYYRMAVNIGTVGHQIQWVMQSSLIKTLAVKNQETIRTTYKRYVAKSEDGLTCLEHKIVREGREPLVARFGGFPLRYEPNAKIVDYTPQIQTGRTQLEQRLLADQCERCGSKENVEVHHIRGIKDLIQKYRKRGLEQPPWVTHMAEAYRKTLVVCATCHQQIHAGTYDGKKLI